MNRKWMEFYAVWDAPVADTLGGDKVMNKVFLRAKIGEKICRKQANRKRHRQKMDRVGLEPTTN